MNHPRFLDSKVKERVLTMEGKFTLSLLMAQSKTFHFILILGLWQRFLIEP